MQFVNLWVWFRNKYAPNLLQVSTDWRRFKGKKLQNLPALLGLIPIRLNIFYKNVTKCALYRTLLAIYGESAVI